MSDIRTNSETQYLGFPHERKQKVDCTPEPSPVPLERTESAPIVPVEPSPVPVERTVSVPVTPLERTESLQIMPVEPSQAASPVQVSRTSSSAVVPDAPVKKTKGIRKSKKSCRDLIKAGEKVKKVTFDLPEIQEEACVVSSASSSDVEQLSESPESGSHDNKPDSEQNDAKPDSEQNDAKPDSEQNNAKPDSEQNDAELLDYGMRQYGPDDCPLVSGDADDASLPF